MTKRWSTRRKLLLQLALIPILLIGVEVGFRLWLRVTEGPYDAANTAQRIRAVADVVDKPLVAWNTNVGRKASATGPPPLRIPSATHGWDYDSMPQRIRTMQRYFGGKRGAETYDVLIIGGSVAAGFHRDGSERLIELLSADPRFDGRPVDTFSLARGGFKQPQQLNQVTYALAMGIRPDAVVNLDGFNEVALGNQNLGYDAHPLHPSIPHWGHLSAFGRANEDMLDGMLALRHAQKRARSVADAADGWEWSAVMGRLFRSAMRRVRMDHVVSTMNYGDAIAQRGLELRLFGPDFDRDFEAVNAQIVEGWVESSISLNAVCRAHDVYYVHALQPTLYDHGSKTLTKEELRTSGAHDTWRKAVPHGYPMMRDAAERLRAAGVVFVDGSMALRDSEETLYYDACHFYAPGHVLLADVIAAGFLAGLPSE